MATLAELRTDIALDLDRDDINTGGESAAKFTLAIARAVEFYSDQAFWFNRRSTTTPTIASTGTVAVPASIRIPDEVSYLGEPLNKVDLADIEARTETGLPCCWAAANGLIQLWPIPDAAYTLTIGGIAQIDAPVLDADTTVWLTTAYDLIAARVKVILNRMFKDYEAMQAAQAEEAEALSRLRNESRRRSVTPLKTDLATGPSFNINRGY